MPRIATSTIETVARTLDDGASLVAALYRGQRGPPVGFGVEQRGAPLALGGDPRAKSSPINCRVAGHLLC